jgi:hypothetical protein
METDLVTWLTRSRNFEVAAHIVLSANEGASKSRVITLSQAYDKVKALNVRQDGMMRESLKCVEYGLNRAAYVMSWAACVDLIKEKLASDGLTKLRAQRPNWPQNVDINELAEKFPEYQLIEALKAVGLVGKGEMNALIGLLQRRNECAHPTGYVPTLNETLGYISEVMQRIQRLAPKSLLGHFSHL